MTGNDSFAANSGEHQIIHVPNVGMGISHKWDMWHNPTNEMVGTMHQHKDGTVLAIEVHPEHRRQGVATKMWGMVNSLSRTTEGIPAPRHSSSRTPSGEKFAKSIGGELPKRTVISQKQFKETLGK